MGKSMTEPIKLESLYIRIKGKLLIFLQFNNAALFKQKQFFVNFTKGRYQKPLLYLVEPSPGGLQYERGGDARRLF